MRVATVFCFVVGALSLVRALVVSLPLVSHTWLPLLLNTTAALLMCAAGVYAWRRSRLSPLLVILAWAVPTAANILGHEAVQPPILLMVLALVVLFANWHELGRPPHSHVSAGD